MQGLFDAAYISILRREKEGALTRLKCREGTKPVGLLLPVLVCPYVKKEVKTNIFIDTVWKLSEIYRKEGFDEAAAITKISAQTELNKKLVKTFIDNKKMQINLFTGALEESTNYENTYLLYDLISGSYFDGYLNQRFLTDFQKFDKTQKDALSAKFTVNEESNLTYGPYYYVFSENINKIPESIPEPSVYTFRKITGRNWTITDKDRPIPAAIACRCYLPFQTPDELHIEFPWSNGDYIMPRYFLDLMEKHIPENETVYKEIERLKSRKKSIGLFSERDAYAEKIDKRYLNINRYENLWHQVSSLERAYDRYKSSRYTAGIDDVSMYRIEIAYQCHTVFEKLFAEVYKKRTKSGLPAVLANFDTTSDEARKQSVRDLLVKNGFYSGKEPDSVQLSVIDEIVSYSAGISNDRISGNIKLHKLFLACMSAAAEEPDLIPMKRAAADPVCLSFPEILTISLQQRNERGHKITEIQENKIPSAEDIELRYQMADHFIDILLAPRTNADEEYDEEDTLSGTFQAETDIFDKYPALKRRSSNDIRDIAEAVLKNLKEQNGNYFMDALTMLSKLVELLLAPEYKRNNLPFIAGKFNFSEDAKEEAKALVYSIKKKHGCQEYWIDKPDVRKYFRHKGSDLTRASASALYYIMIVYLDNYNPDYLDRILHEIPKLHKLIDACTIERAHSNETVFKNNLEKIQQFNDDLMETSNLVCEFLEKNGTSEKKSE